MSTFDADYRRAQLQRLQIELDNVHRNQRWAGWLLMFTALTAFWFWIFWELTA
jgi:hypothetical protein